MEEPSVLDYVKSKLFPWLYSQVEIPPDLSEEEAGMSRLAGELDFSAASHPTEERFQSIGALDQPSGPARPRAASQPRSQPAGQVTNWKNWPWFGLPAVFLAMLAQYSMSPQAVRTWQNGIFLLLMAAGLLLAALRRNEVQLAPLPEAFQTADAPAIHAPSLLVGTLLTSLALLSFGNLLFTRFNLFLLLLALAFMVRAFWPSPGQTSLLKAAFTSLLAYRPRPIRLTINRQTVLVLASIALVFFFRYFRLHQTPPEMNSDHAEKILDVARLLAGQTMIFFPSNGGREALQFYLAAGLHQYLGLPLGFGLLKLVTISVGFLSLPFIYLLGKELGNRRVGMLAFLFAGVAYWPNVVARAGMRLPFYILFTAATLYFLLRSFRTGRRKDFIFAGIVLGLSFYGYSADRILPLVAALAAGLYLLHRASRGRRLETLVSLLALAAVGLVIFVPLLRYILAEPEAFLFRTMTRMGSLEQPLANSPWAIFLSNNWNALKMFSWDAGVIWPVSVPNYPALGTVTGGLFYLGILLALVRYIRRRTWQDLFLILSIPILMLPSTLSLAFPGENPSLYRTGGVSVIVFVLVALVLDGLIDAMTTRFYIAGAGLQGVSTRWRHNVAWGMVLFLFGLSCLQDYDLVFNRYYHNYQLSSWNTSEMGQVIRDFGDTLGSYDTAWVVGYPHWADTRLVAIQAGFPTGNYAIFIDQLESTLAEKRAKMFIVNPLDAAAIETLPKIYPQGWFQTYQSKAPTKDFLMFFVPPAP